MHKLLKGYIALLFVLTSCYTTIDVSSKLNQPTIVNVNAAKKIKTKKRNVAGSCWITKTGKKYHSYNHCGRTNPSTCTKSTVAKAKSRGLKPCSKCC